MSFLLSDAERDRFASYCEMEYTYSMELVKQMENAKLPEAAIKHFKNEGLAFGIIARKLRRTESMTLEGEKKT